MTRIFGISGQMGSGKDYVSDHVAFTVAYEMTTVRVVKLRFSAALREEIDRILTLIRNSFTKSQAVDAVRKEFSVLTSQCEKIVDILWQDAQDPDISSQSRTASMRQAMQYWGTDVRRASDENYWVNKTKELASQHLRDPHVFVIISDARFPNEVHAVKDLGGKTIRVEVDDDIRSKRLQDRDGIGSDFNNHESETALSGLVDFDFIYDNSTSGIRPELDQWIKENIGDYNEDH